MMMVTDTIMPIMMIDTVSYDDISDGDDDAAHKQVIMIEKAIQNSSDNWSDNDNKTINHKTIIILSR